MDRPRGRRAGEGARALERGEIDGLGRRRYLAASRARRRAAGGDGPNHDVVVVPASTLGNWKREFKRFAPRENVVVYHGGQAERADMRTDPGVLSADVVLTTYTWWERDACDADREWFGRRAPWAHVVLDEGHALKNPDASRSKRLRRLKSPSRTILSGTPIMNRPLDLLSLLLFLMPGLFRECQVTDRLGEVLEALEDEGGVARLRALLAPFCLRRIKADVLASLPAKATVVRAVALDARQRKAYARPRRTLRLSRNPTSAASTEYPRRGRGAAATVIRE